MLEPRPTIDEAMKMKAAQSVAERMGDISYADSIARQYQYPMDGYELAKDLDRYECWDTTREEMEALDAMDHLIHKALEKAEKEWFERNDIKPPLEVGAKVKCRGIIGTITDIASHGYAKFLVKPDGQDDATSGNKRYVIKFEDALAA